MRGSLGGDVSTAIATSAQAVPKLAENGFGFLAAGLTMRASVDGLRRHGRVREGPGLGCQLLPGSRGFPAWSFWTSSQQGKEGAQGA